MTRRRAIVYFLLVTRLSAQSNSALLLRCFLSLSVTEHRCMSVRLPGSAPGRPIRVERTKPSCCAVCCTAPARRYAQAPTPGVSKMVEAVLLLAGQSCRAGKCQLGAHFAGQIGRKVEKACFEGQKKGTVRGPKGPGRAGPNSGGGRVAPPAPTSDAPDMRGCFFDLLELHFP